MLWRKYWAFRWTVCAMPKVSNVYPYETKKGRRWYFTASCGTDSKGKRIQIKRRGFKTQTEAKKAHDAFVADYEQNRVIAGSAMTYRQFLETIFLPEYKAEVRASTYESRSNMLLKSSPSFIDMRLCDVTVSIVQLWKNDLCEKYENNYIRLLFGYAQMAFDKAKALGYIKTNPFRTVKNIGKRKVQIVFWTKEEFESVMRTLDLSDYKQLWAFTCIWYFYFTGLRLGEGQALRWSKSFAGELDATRVSEQMNLKNQHEWELTPPKTGAGIRTVRHDLVTKKVLMRWRDVQQRNIDTDWVLSWQGAPLYGNELRKVMNEHADMAGVKHIKIHGLRHSHASYLINNGENALAVQKRLGHEDIETTLGTYGHLFPEVDDGLADRLGKGFEGWI